MIRPSAEAARDLLYSKVAEAEVAAMAMRAAYDGPAGGQLNVVVLTDAEIRAMLPGRFRDALLTGEWSGNLQTAVEKLASTQPDDVPGAMHDA